MEWDFVNSKEEIIARFGIEYYNSVHRIVEAQKNDIRTDGQKIDDAVSFIMNGPGGN